MKEPLLLSRVTLSYLTRYDEILRTMICGMTDAELTDSISHNFIVQMIPHHEAAIDMSRNLLQYTTCLPLQRIAEGIIDEQTRGIAQMREVLEACSVPENTPRDLMLYQRRLHRVMQIMFSRMSSACRDNRINANFMREMIPHHQGAIRMSEAALCFPICPQLRPILREIIVSQSRGVQQMEQLLACAGSS